MKVYLDMIGCRLNQAEIEDYARQFSAAGCQVVEEPSHADLALINTCAVTKAASSDSRQKIRQAHRAGAGEVHVTGCWSTLNPAAASLLPGVTRVIPNANKDILISDQLPAASRLFELEPLERDYRLSNRPRTRAFLKVQDGCNNHCTFCIIRLARGPARTISEAEILNKIKQVSDPGLGRFAAREIVITGVHLGAWGKDLSPRKRLFDLISTILHHTDVPRVRLSSLEPWDLDRDFFSLWQNSRLCPHIHLPLQSGCNETLKRMNRNTTIQCFRELVQIARESIPGLAITTDIITGFPGENEEEFESSAAFIKEMNFAGGHVFTFSAQEGTAAGGMKDQVPFDIRKQRNARIRSLLEESARRYRERFIGSTVEVLWESISSFGPGGWEMSGSTGNNIRVKACSSIDLWNSVSQVQLVSSQNGMIRGKLTGSEIEPTPIKTAEI
jgi:threonylcarbamoyladenosine tRNA methylthiotransferase MtaB